MELNDNDNKFIRHYNNLHKSFLGIFLFIVFGVFFQFYVMIYKYIPIYLKIFNSKPDIRIFLEQGFQRCLGTSIIWIIILLGVLIGNFLVYIKVKRIFNKIKRRE